MTAHKIEPHKVIDAQLDAYRARDIEKFASFCSANIKAFSRNELLCDGIEDLKIKYKALFDASPELAVIIEERRIEGPYVFDTELITGLRGNPDQIKAFVRYTLEGSKIVEVQIHWPE